jgi:hypothetical protein
VFHDHAREFDAGTHPELAKDLAQVRVDGVTGQKESLADLAIGQPGRDEAGDVSFRVAQGSEAGGEDAWFCCRHDPSVRLAMGRRILHGA